MELLNYFRKSEPQVRFQASAATAAGAKHLRKGLTNQDACRVHSEAGELGPPLVLAAADGHGDPRHYRSDRGARLAVEAASVVFDEIRGRRAEQNIISYSARALLQQELPKRIVSRWQDLVDEDLRQHPPRPSEWHHLDRDALADDREYPRVAYGTTLNLLGATDNIAVMLRIGDGQFLTVTSTGQSSWPFGYDESMDHATASLCSTNADELFECRTLLMTDIDLILVSTDGFIRPQTRLAVEEFATDVWEDLQGADSEASLTRELIAQLEAWTALEQPEGAQALEDDVTLGVLYRRSPKSRQPDRRAHEPEIEYLPAIHGKPDGLDETRALAPSSLPAADEKTTAAKTEHNGETDAMQSNPLPVESH